MKKLLINILFILYSFVSVMILGAGIIFPFQLAMQECSDMNWIGWIIYPSVLLIMGLQKKVLEYFNQQL